MFESHENLPATKPEMPSEPATAPRHAPKWNPPLRYAKDKFGATLIHSGPNRADRRADAAFRRKKKVSRQITLPNGKVVTESIPGLGERSENRRMLRHFGGRPLTNVR